MAKKKVPLIEDEQYQQLTSMPSEKEWLDNCKAKSSNTACAYERDLNDFKSFAGVETAEDFRRVTRKHLVDWVSTLKKRKISEPGRRNYGKKLSKMTIKRKLYAVGSYFKYCCKANALRDSPVRGVETPGKRSREGAYAFLSKQEVKRLRDAPPFDSLAGKRDRAILATFVYHALRVSEVCKLRVRDIQSIDGEPHFKVQGKGGEDRSVLIHDIGLERVNMYLDAVGNKDDLDAPLFCPLKKYKDEDGNLKPLTTQAVYNIVMNYAGIVGIETEKLFSPHALRGTAATHALKAGADPHFVQKWMGHADLQTTMIYDSRKEDNENSPTRKVNY